MDTKGLWSFLFIAIVSFALYMFVVAPYLGGTLESFAGFAILSGGIFLVFNWIKKKT